MATAPASAGTSAGFTTRLLNADRELADDLSVSPPLHQSVNHAARDAEHLKEIARPLGDRYYTRAGNPTCARLAACIADLEGAETGIITASGMGAITTAVLGLVRAGDHVVGQTNHYIGLTKLLTDTLPGFGVATSRVDQRSVEAFAAAIRPNTRLIMLETPVNPTMHLTDLKAVAAIAQARGIVTICDNTFATPLNQRPIALGIDLVMHSVTKYLGGHHDLLAGAVVGRRALIERIWEFGMTAGAIGAPFNAWLALRGMRTLELRLRQHNQNGQAVATFLAGHPAIAAVFYPGLADHPQHVLARAQMTGFGGLLTFELKGGYRAAEAFIGRLKLVSLASSLGGVSSCVIQPATLFGERLTPEAVAQQGITPGQVRLACGIENTEDLVADIAQALGEMRAY